MADFNKTQNYQNGKPNEPYSMRPAWERETRPAGGMTRSQHDREVTISAWVQAWNWIIKPLLGGLFVAFLWGASALYSNGWVNAPVKTTELAAATNYQKITNVELKSAIDAVAQKADTHDRILEKLATVTGEMRADVAFIKGMFASSVQAYAPSPISPPTPFGQLQRPQNTWATRQSN
jgi:hypothetical protein